MACGTAPTDQVLARTQPWTLLKASPAKHPKESVLQYETADISFSRNCARCVWRRSPPSTNIIQGTKIDDRLHSFSVSPGYLHSVVFKQKLAKRGERRLRERLRGTEAAAGPTASWMNYVQYMRMVKVRANYNGQIPCKNTGPQVVALTHLWKNTQRNSKNYYIILMQLNHR